MKAMDAFMISPHTYTPLAKDRGSGISLCPCREYLDSFLREQPIIVLLVISQSEYK
jgi:hypothetical protein